MRYRFAALLLLAGLPGITALAAPAPEPFAILDIGPPPKGESAEQYRKRQLDAQTHPLLMSVMSADPAVKKLPSAAGLKNADPWYAENFRITAEGERRLRITFQGGNRAEQAAIINALARVNLHFEEQSIKAIEGWIRTYEKGILESEMRIKSSRDLQEIASLQHGVQKLRNEKIPACRAEIARRKQFVVIRWAK